ncbi:serine protease [Stutzerimonas nosocomialis]|uniref:S8 family serine peptidase n=2 Tax=Stutzerimonas nosocomialis TaxID=1056496 RepID=UPI00110879F2|nr:S8 family serine peptidase [Stutzerimonas nosocomialis]TLX53303.1 serine protease [Stutzerimonas nosocomialis]TLX55983.1 serine protease [Stutzerimonas nosocomialis]
MMIERRMGMALAGLLGLGCGDLMARPTVESIEGSLRSGRPHVAGELIVQFRAEASEEAKSAAYSRHAASPARRLASKRERRDGRGDLVKVRLAGKRLDRATLAAFLNDPAVEYVEPNWVYRTQRSNPNDPGLEWMWGLQGPTTSPAHPYGSGALAAWNASALCSSQVHVGVIDEGVMVNHPDLRANVWVNPGEGSRPDGQDNDRNGFVDDVHGWDFDANDASVFDGVQDDHGTHVAGTIAAVTNNGIGVAGVCPSAKLIAAKFLGADGGTTAGAIAAVNYLTTLKREKRIALVATNNSWGGGGYSQALADAIRAAGDAGILFIAAAGNDGLDIDRFPSYPASYALPNVITVAAHDPSGARAEFSNYGAASVHLSAPGVDIISTAPMTATEGGYAYYSGTSMAAPHVAGAAALYASLNPCASAAQIRDALLRHAVRDPQLIGSVQQGRRLDVSGFRRELACTAP